MLLRSALSFVCTRCECTNAGQHNALYYTHKGRRATAYMRACEVVIGAPVASTPMVGNTGVSEQEHMRVGAFTKIGGSQVKGGACVDRKSLAANGVRVFWILAVYSNIVWLFDIHSYNFKQIAWKNVKISKCIQSTNT